MLPPLLLLLLLLQILVARTSSQCQCDEMIAWCPT